MNPDSYRSQHGAPIRAFLSPTLSTSWRPGACGCPSGCWPPRRGRAVPIVASPSLEHTRIDLTAVPDAGVGDEVVIIGRQGDAEITAAEVAERHGLGLHHVATVGPRVAREETR